MVQNGYANASAAHRKLSGENTCATGEANLADAPILEIGLDPDLENS